MIYFWVFMIQPETTDGWDNGGIRLYLEDGSGNYSEWSVGGGGGGGSYRNYFGGFRRFAVDTSTTPDYVSGTLNLSAVTYIGVTVKNTAKFKATEEIYVDDFEYHSNSTYAYTVTGGASAPRDFAELASQDDSSGYGIFVEGLEGGPYYQVGPIRWGDTGTSSLTFEDTNQYVTNYDCYRAFTTTNRTSAESLLTSGQYDWTITGNGTGTTSFTLGTKSGTEGISGCVIKQGNTSDPLMNIAADSNVATFKIYGCTFIDIGTFTTPTTTANREVISTTFSGCGTTTPSTCVFTYCKWVSSTGVAVELSSTSHNLTYCQFISSGTYGIKFTATGTYTLSGVTFTGSTTADIENSNNATDSASYTTQDSAQQLYSGATEGTAQSFAGVAADLTNVVLKLRKVGNPTGNATVKLYTHSGTYGTSSVPTTPLLATAKTIDVSTLQTSLTDEKIDFDDSEFYTLSSGTNYVIAIEYAGGDSGNYIEVGYDAGGSHGGNKADYNGVTWSAVAADDLYFKCRTGGDVTISAQNDADPGTTAETGTPPGTTNINNEVTLQITVLKDADGGFLENAQCSIYLLASPYTELMNEDSNASGVASEGYNYGGATDIKWRVRKSETTDDPRYIPQSGTGQISANGFTQTVRMKVNPFL
jgi:hypothetical protein